MSRSALPVDQKFTAKTPTLITSVSDLVGNVTTGAPKTSLGSQGDYAINTTHVTNKIYKKTASNTWAQLGSTSWHSSVPAIESTAGVTVTSGHNIKINGKTVAASSTTLSNVASQINAASIPNVTANFNSVTNKLEIFHSGLNIGDSTSGANTTIPI